VRYVLTALTFVGVLAVAAVLAFVAVMVFAGPHSDILPGPLQVVVYLAGWAAVLALPILAARAVWRRTGAVQK
jgi:hypothetical protein